MTRSQIYDKGENDNKKDDLMEEKKTPRIYSGSAPKNGNDLRPLSAIINI